METPWQPQRSAQDAPIALLKNYISLLKLPVSRSTIEKEISELPGFPKIGLNDITAALKKWGLSTEFIQVPINILFDIPKPTVSFIYEQHGEKKSGNFIIVTAINQEQVKYLHIRKGWITEELESFKANWAGAALIITEMNKDEWGEKDFESKERVYIDAKNANPELQNIKIVDDFLTDEECSYIIHLSSQRFERSKLTGDALLEGFGRTSYTADLVFSDDVILNSIRKRAAELITMPESHFEYFQCVSYEKGQEYMNHFNTFDENTEIGKKALLNGGQRMYTMLVYLNDDYTGGETHFPNLDYLVQPKKKRVVIFNNLDENSNVIHAAYHAGLPVSSGRKYAINMWVREKPILDC